MNYDIVKRELDCIYDLFHLADAYLDECKLKQARDRTEDALNSIKRLIDLNEEKVERDKLIANLRMRGVNVR